jgi:hypothetical protein
MAEKTASDKPETVTNPWRAKTQQARLDVIVNLALGPCLICFLAFTRPVLYRAFGIGGKFVDVVHGVEDVVITKKCPKFAWLNNADFKVTCDHRPLDIHGVLAVAWLILFTAQCLMIKFRFRAFHKLVGKGGMWIALVNIMGMLFLSVYDVFYPMEDTSRPRIFNLFMWNLTAQMFIYLKSSYEALQKHDIEMHALWMFRAFVKSFTTPVMRFYPLVLRYFFGTKCSELNREKAVMGSVGICLLFIVPLSWFSNVYVLKEPMDKYMKSTIGMAVVTLCLEAVWFYHKGFYITGMFQCHRYGADNYDPITNTAISFSQGEL